MSNSSSIQTNCEESTENIDKTIESLNLFEENHRNWFQLSEELITVLDSKFDIICEKQKQINNLLEEIEDKKQKRLKSLIIKSNVNIDEKTSEDLTETDLLNESIALNSCLDSLRGELIDKKEYKTLLTNKTKTLTKQLEEMENRVKDLKQNKSNDCNEYLILANVMRVMYKTWNNSQVIGLLFNDNQEKSLDKLIVIDKENKSEEQMSQQFWESLEKDYRINI